MRITIPPSKRRERLIVAVDFGTTFSGCALAYSGDPESADEIQVVKNWPGSNGITSDKVPSELVYETPTQVSGIKRDSSGEPINNTKIRWGLEIKPDETRLRCLKLRLDPRQKLPDYVSEDELCKELKKSGKTAEEAISDYLTEIYRRAKEALVKRFTQHMVSTTVIEVVLTVPAIWTDAAKDATLRAAERAGMGPNLYMISEPEAAAIYALKSMGQKQKLLQVGDNFIVCDCGGGTKTTSTFSSRGPDGVIGDNQRLIDVVDMQRNFVNTGNRKGGGIFKKVYKDGKKKGQAVISKKGNKSTCTVIDSAKAAFKPAMRLKNDKDVIEAGRKSALKILERYVDAQPRKKGKAKRESKKGKKAKVDEAEDEEHEDEDIDCVGIDKVLEKGPDDEDEGPEGNGGAAFDYVPSGITA